MTGKGRTVDRTPGAGLTTSGHVKLPLESSVGYQLRLTHWSIQRLLQARIAPHSVQLGMWYFLRVLWDEDGSTQRELSDRLGISEPTALHTIAAMERSGLIKRVRNAADRRKMNVFLTRKGRQLEAILLPVAVEVVNEVVRGFAEQDVRQLLGFLKAIQRNLRVHLEGVEAGESDFADMSATARRLALRTGARRDRASQP